MSRKAKIWLTVFLVIMAVIIWFVCAQWNNISAVIDSFRYSQDDVEKMLEDNKESVQKFIDETENVTVRDLTDEEAKALRDGDITEEDVIQILTGQKDIGDVNNPSEETNNSQPEENADNQTEKASSQVISEAIAKLYIQKSTYLSMLDNIEARVRQQYIDLPKEERKGAKQRFLAQYLPEVAAWESQCDSVVYGILDEIKAALDDIGQDKSIVKKLEEAYLNEKKLKKSYFINRYMD